MNVEVPGELRQDLQVMGLMNMASLLAPQAAMLTNQHIKDDRGDV